MADWEFKGGALSFKQLSEILYHFQNDSPVMNFRKFTLEMSSWYMSENEAFNLLKDTLNLDSLKNAIKSSQGQPETNPNRDSTGNKLRVEEAANMETALDYFINNMDYKYLNANRKFNKKF